MNYDEHENELDTEVLSMNTDPTSMVLGGYEIVFDADTCAPVELLCNGEKVRDLDEDDIVTMMADIILSMSSRLRNITLSDEDLVELRSPLLTNKYTRVMRESNYKYNAPHRYRVITADDSRTILSDIKFQEGPIKECGVNGVCNEDLINMVIERLEHFQNSEFNCRENALAITKLQESLMWLRFRTTSREIRGVEGTHTV